MELTCIFPCTLVRCAPKNQGALHPGKRKNREQQLWLQHRCPSTLESLHGFGKAARRDRELHGDGAVTRVLYIHALNRPVLPAAFQSAIPPCSMRLFRRYPWPSIVPSW